MLIVFDVIGTLFSLDRVQQTLQKQGIHDNFTELWFLRLLHSATSCTLTGNYQSFAKLMLSTLHQSLAAGGYDEQLSEEILPAFRELELWDDAKPCLTSLKQSDFQLIALTNGSKDSTFQLMEQANIIDNFDAIYSCDEIGACKPHSAPYQWVLNQRKTEPQNSYMVAAHAWDIMGAQTVGMQTLWISRLEKRWPFPGNPPGKVTNNLGEVKRIFS